MSSYDWKKSLFVKFFFSIHLIKSCNINPSFKKTNKMTNANLLLNKILDTKDIIIIKFFATLI